MKVILLKDVKGLGKKDDIKEVSDGYASNFLFPRKLAVQYSKGSAEVLEKQIDNRNEIEHNLQEEAKKNALLLKDVVLKFTLKVGEGGKTFGSVTSKQIKEKLESDFKIKIDRKRIQLAKNLDTLGVHIVKVEFHKGITGTLKVMIEEE